MHIGCECIANIAPKLWNSLPLFLKGSCSKPALTKALKTHLFRIASLKIYFHTRNCFPFLFFSFIFGCHCIEHVFLGMESFVMLYKSTSSSLSSSYCVCAASKFMFTWTYQSPLTVCQPDCYNILGYVIHHFSLQSHLFVHQRESLKFGWHQKILVRMAMTSASHFLSCYGNWWRSFHRELACDWAWPTPRTSLNT